MDNILCYYRFTFMEVQRMEGKSPKWNITIKGVPL